MRPEDRERIQVEVVSRIVERYQAQARSAPDGWLENLVHDTLYHERKRLETEHDSESTRAWSAFYDAQQRRLRHASATDLRGIVEQIARRFVHEVTGNFDERVYRLSTKVIPPGLWMLLNAMSPERLVGQLRSANRSLSAQVQVSGEVDHVRGLLQHGTLVVVPTHCSNLDSILLGYTTYLAGIPPLTYGAGLNLFSNPVLAYFMRNLGAYRVDRKKQAAIYKDVLKEYATCSMEMGYHNLFFPGGTRSRSGMLEQKLKMGLLGSAVRAYVANLQARKALPNLYVVPATLSYKLVLEAETLIGDHLKETGRSRYIIEDDESSKPRKILNFLSGLYSMQSQIVLRYSKPMDIFGNPVDREGRSLDPHGRVIDTSRYVLRDGQPVHDDSRDTQYTREVADQVVRAYLRDNVVMTTHVVAFTVWDLLRQANPGTDLYRLLRTGGGTPSFPMTVVHAGVARVMQVLRSRADGPQFGQTLQGGDIPEIVDDALKHFAAYHTRPALVRRGDRVFHEDRNLLLYYGNRLRGYDLGRELAREVKP